MDITALGIAGFATLLACAVPFYAWRERGRTYAIAAAVILTLSFPSILLTGWHLGRVFPEAAPWLDLGFGCGFAVGAAHLGSLVRARLRPRAFRWMVSIPGMTWIAAGVLSLFTHLALAPLRIGAWALGTALPTWWFVLELLPFAVALASIPTSLSLRREFVRIPLGGEGEEGVFSRVPVHRCRRPPPESVHRCLRIVQIADPHLGPWQPIHRLQRRVRSLLAHRPDLILLTGDFLTMESRGSPGSLEEALAPLREASGRCFAVFGNHDHEAPEEVRAGLEANGVQLLVDQEVCVETEVGPVQILGSDWNQRDAGNHLETLLARHPRRAKHLRLLLLHDPVAFPSLRNGEVDLTLSGHTHGGQLGLLSLGLNWTVLSRTRWPDHGLFALGRSRLYVHRGTGFYGFPLRVGVPGEASLLELVAPAQA